MTGPIRKPERRRAIPMAGFLATAIAFGPARMGFGLFLPEFRDSFQITTNMAGTISSAAFAASFAALPIGAQILNARGPQAPVLLGGCAATIGLALAALAQDLWVLSAGIVVAATSAGLCWTPYNNAAERFIRRDRRARSLSIISTGTAVGTMIAGGLALLLAINGLDWRWAWSGFALAALVMTLTNMAALGPVAGKAGPDAGMGSALSRLRDPDAAPLIVAALSFGLTGAVFLSFAVDHATSAGALAIGPLDSAAPLLFVSFGLMGLAGLFAGEIEARIGLVALLRLTFAVSAVSLMLLALLPGAGWAVLLSAGLQGAVVMMTSAILSFWSVRLFPQLPSVSFTAVLTVVAAGNVLGPILAGWAGTQAGLDIVFLGASVIALSTPLLMNRDRIETVSGHHPRHGAHDPMISPDHQRATNDLTDAADMV